MATFDITPEKLQDYKRSLAGMRKDKARLKRVARRKEGDQAEQAEYRIELINVIEGYMMAVIQEGDKRFRYSKRH